MDLFLFWGGIVTIVANASKNISHLGSIIIFFLHQVDFLEDVLVSLLLGTDASLVLRFLLRHSSKSLFFIFLICRDVALGCLVASQGWPASWRLSLSSGLTNQIFPSSCSSIMWMWSDQDNPRALLWCSPAGPTGRRRT